MLILTSTLQNAARFSRKRLSFHQMGRTKLSKSAEIVDASKKRENLGTLLFSLSNISGITPRNCDEAEEVTETSTGKRKAAKSQFRPRKKVATNSLPQGVGYGSAGSGSKASATMLQIDDRSLTEILKGIATSIKSTPLSTVVDLTSEKNDDPAILEIAKSIENSCLLPFMESYLQNESLLDVERHQHLYSAIFSILRLFCDIVEMRSLLFELPHQKTSLYELTKELADRISFYYHHTNKNNTVKEVQDVTDESLFLEIERVMHSMNSIRRSKQQQLQQMKEVSVMSSSGVICIDIDESDEDDDTVEIPAVEVAVTKPSVNDGEADKKNPSKQEKASSDEPVETEEERLYKASMRPLQYMEVEAMKSCCYLRIPPLQQHHQQQQYYGMQATAAAATAPATSNTARRRRLAQEHADLSHALPLSLSSTIWVRTLADRMDILQFLVSGPEGTPYENGLFLFDVMFPADYPHTPPKVSLQTTGRGTVRFNPNLYNCGKVCLSLLGTWSGAQNEMWNSSTSTFLQVLISIQSLILVPEPYYNEPGFEARYRANNPVSKAYNENIRNATVQWAMLDHLKNNTLEGFEDVVTAHFSLKKREIIAQLNRWNQEKPCPYYNECIATLNRKF